MKIDRNTSNTICPLPFMSFYGTAGGQIVACCESQEIILSNEGESFKEAWNNQKYKKLRKELIEGKKPDLCKKCWKNEEEGLKSNRQQALEDIESGYYDNTDIITNQEGELKSYPSFIELKSSNICNLKCLMCHPESSHRIIEDKEIIEKYRKDLPWNTEPLRSERLVSHLINDDSEILDSIKILQYSGGEPLISAEQFELTNILSNKNAENIQLRYSTNLNNLTFEKYDALELWSKFKNVNLKISADGIYDVYNYIRRYGEFQTVVENLEFLKKRNLPNMTLGLGFTTQIYNIFQLPETIDFFSKYLDLPSISTHLLYTPSLLCIEIMPPKLCERIIKKLSSSKWDFSDKIHFLERVIENDNFSEKRWNRFLSYTKEIEGKNNIFNGYNYLSNKYLDGF